MKYTQKSVARIVSAYFFFLITTNVFLQATFLPLSSHQQVDAEKTEIPTDLALLTTRSAVLDLEVEEIIEEEVPPIIIDHHDITGLKRIVRNKRKRNARRNAPSRRNFIPAVSVPSLPVAYNAIFDSLNASSLRLNIIEEAKKYLGLRYIWGGTTPKGFDCSGFTSYVLAQEGVGIARSSRYQARQGKDIDMTNAKTGDLIFFSKYGKGGRVTHVAMVVDNKKDGVYIIHSTRRGIVVDNLSESSYWKPKVLYAKDVISKG
ncbi:C40 family peptidase [Aureispira anguillae]|uniref:C40 family peptidase n=1 Tax=Aureispira anguillae TaxID=2864201 RepID=A0A915YFP0_9BACT|nr:C40 family peptidase [Aureispira anguillae]BDS12290.1 C40 family peptidase [Aureispira anguillae]